MIELMPDGPERERYLWKIHLISQQYIDQDMHVFVWVAWFYDTRVPVWNSIHHSGGSKKQLRFALDFYEGVCYRILWWWICREWTRCMDRRKFWSSGRDSLVAAKLAFMLSSSRDTRASILGCLWHLASSGWSTQGMIICRASIDQWISVNLQIDRIWSLNVYEATDLVWPKANTRNQHIWRCQGVVLKKAENHEKKRNRKLSAMNSEAGGQKKLLEGQNRIWWLNDLLYQ